MASENSIFKDVKGSILIMCLIQILFAIYTGAFDGYLTGPDGYMWLNRVIYLHENGDWYNHTLPRINPPVGFEQHWTRPFDALLLLGTWILTPLFGFSESLYIWSLLVSPLLEAFSIIAIYWAFSPVLIKNNQEPLGILFITQIIIISTYQIGRPDHQILLFALFIISVGYMVRLIMQPYRWRLCFGAGLTAAISIWISVESLLFIFINISSLSYLWLIGQHDMGRKLLHFTLVINIFTHLALLLERGASHFLLPVYDQISIVYVTLFTLLTLYWCLVRIAEIVFRWPMKMLSRTLLSLMGITTIVLTMHYLYPGFIAGPLNEMDELYKKVSYVNILELQPLLSIRKIYSGEWLQQLSKLVLWMGICFPGIAVLARFLYKTTGSKFRIFAYISFGVLIYLPLALREVRWIPYVVILVLPFYTWLVARILLTISNWTLRKAAIPLRMVMLILCAFIFTFPAIMFGTGIDDKQSSACNLTAISSYLNNRQHMGEESKRILAHVDYGPEILYRTNHSVYSIGNHRYSTGFTDGYNFLTARDDDTARTIARRLQPDLILVCPEHDKGIYTRQDNMESFLDRLAIGKHPAWLRELQLPPELAKSFNLYEVNKEVVYQIRAPS